MTDDLRDIVARSNAILNMGVMMQDAECMKSDVKAFFVVIKGGPKSRTASVCTGAAGILNLTWDTIDGLAALEMRKRPYVLQPIFHRDPTTEDLRGLAESATTKAPGSLIVVALRRDETAIQDARNTLSDVPGILATCCFQ